MKYVIKIKKQFKKIIIIAYLIFVRDVIFFYVVLVLEITHTNLHLLK